ncbi:MAG: hypothetical protein EWV48_18645 [Microcystis aeruginosa Ma_QC_C_20070823_S13]|nr:MAG: hypothetical protein EWV56_20310 [Microcystis aeruginosa Ma_QC_C_20070823_S13D]TRU57418.1 MAG: hypothetical protein EWV48_18645 [Microcystis aeruginosa Ma_QC_C_20070823_S13]
MVNRKCLIFWTQSDRSSKKRAVKLSSASAINRCSLLFCDSILADSVIAFPVHKRYIIDSEKLNQQRLNCASQMREPL